MTHKLPHTTAERLPIAQRFLSERMIKSSPLRAEDAERFRALFGVELKDYWEGLLKLDVIKFDEFIKPNENESTAEAIVRKYGQDACNFIRGLL